MRALITLTEPTPERRVPTGLGAGIVFDTAFSRGRTSFRAGAGAVRLGADVTAAIAVPGRRVVQDAK
ncbi:hypothetical protein GXW82_03465 [Streptacidiphilus sp. 4-A2]|nr:hypothetical protein [Streptacidiphilus sp. 4-A2]